MMLTVPIRDREINNPIGMFGDLAYRAIEAFSEVLLRRSEIHCPPRMPDLSNAARPATACAPCDRAHLSCQFHPSLRPKLPPPQKPLDAVGDSVETRISHLPLGWNGRRRKNPDEIPAHETRQFFLVVRG
jgi:hypothetical protein